MVLNPVPMIVTVLPTVAAEGANEDIFGAVPADGFVVVVVTFVVVVVVFAGTAVLEALVGVPVAVVVVAVCCWLEGPLFIYEALAQISTITRTAMPPRMYRFFIR